MSLWDYLNKTNLPIKKEVDFQIQKEEQRPFDSGVDYDLRGFFNKYGNLQPQATNGHLTDEFKIVIHPSYSVESRYYKGGPFAINWNEPLYKKLSRYGAI